VNPANRGVYQSEAKRALYELNAQDMEFYRCGARCPRVRATLCSTDAALAGRTHHVQRAARNTTLAGCWIKCESCVG
jgi:hypothetical protein